MTQGGVRMRINVNDSVRVRLTPRGREVLAEYNRPYVPLGCPLVVVEDEDGWSRWLLWRLMRVFGWAMVLGCESPFETEIEIEEAQWDAPSMVSRQTQEKP